MRWLLLFKQRGDKMYPSNHKRKFSSLKKLLNPTKAKIRDILRHTYISFRVGAFEKSIGSTAAESGNSEKIIIDHYLDLVVNPAHVKRFWRITPRTLGLSKSRRSLTAVPLETPCCLE
jgi:hypothetical protein